MIAADLANGEAAEAVIEGFLAIKILPVCRLISLKGAATRPGSKGHNCLITFKFEAEMIHWRGPAPFFFVPLPALDASKIKALSSRLTYGWGVIPVTAEIGGARFQTSLFPKQETYLLPVKAEVRKKANITAGDVVAVEMTVQPAGL